MKKKDANAHVGVFTHMTKSQKAGRSTNIRLSLTKVSAFFAGENTQQRRWSRRPTKAKINLDWSGSDARFKVMDALGRTVLVDKPLQNATELDTSTWPTGLYQIHILGSDFSLARSIQILR